MVQHTFSAEGFEKTDKLQKYVDSKMKELEKYIPRFARESAIMTVRIKRVTKGKVEIYDCRLHLELPHKTLEASEKVEHAYASLDVVTAEIKSQLADYKDKFGRQPLRRRAAAAFRRAGKQDNNL